MKKRLYDVKDGEKALDISNVCQIEGVLGKFIIKDEFHAINDQWNGINQADLEGYVLCLENDEIVYYKIYGFDEDSKIDLNNKWLLKDNDKLPNALFNYCEAFDPFTNEKLNQTQIEKMIK